MLYTQIEFRQGIASEWESDNPVLGLGEPGYEIDTTSLKIGNGVNTWNELPYCIGDVKLKKYLDDYCNSRGIVPIVVNNTLTSTSTSEALAAAQGKNLQDTTVKLTGNQTIAGTKTFSTSPVVPNKTAAAGTSGTAIATEAQVNLKANLASPGFTGTPTAPTAAETVNNTQLATTAFVNRGLLYRRGLNPQNMDTTNLGNPVIFSLSENITGSSKSPYFGWQEILRLAGGGHFITDLAIECITTSTGDAYGGLACRSKYVNASAKWTKWNRVLCGDSALPNADNSFDIGNSGLRWKTLYATSGTINTSDRREKEDISTLDNISNFFMDLNPVSFKFKDGTSGRIHYGLIAQDVEESMTKNGLSTMDFAGLIKSLDPENKDEYKYGLRYSEFIPMNIKMTQDQQKIISSQQEEINTLRSEFDILKQQVTELMSR